MIPNLPQAACDLLASRHRKLIVALGGNALSLPNEEGNIEQQFGHARKASTTLARLVKDGDQLLVTHGNGPQVGNILQRVELASREVYPIPMSIAVADTQAGMGFMIALAWKSALRELGIDREVTPMLTLVEVDPLDPAFTHPTKPIGPFISKESAMNHSQKHGWNVIEMPDGRWRRVVASPIPRSVRSLDVLTTLYNQGHLLIAGGGGGVPVIQNGAGDLELRDAVIDKDLTTALLAGQLEADILMILTGVPNVSVDFGKPTQRDLGAVTGEELYRFHQEGQFPAGSMGPKVVAAVEYLRRTPQPNPLVIITDMDNARAALRGEAGTIITRGESPLA
jgi:carbamate kinase